MPNPAFSRRILHHGPTPAGTPVLLSNRAVTGCWFELLRQGGCGAAEVQLSDEFDAPRDIEPGDWISIEANPGERWYLGRVEEIRSISPAGRRLRLEGMSIQLNEVFPGGFGESADGAKPHRYAATDLFSNDPDRSLETADVVTAADELVRKLLTQYIVPSTDITYDPALVEVPSATAQVVSLKFRGEESVRSIIKDLAMRANAASWGVDASGKFLFLKAPKGVAASFREGRDLTSLTETRDREHLFNRLLLTGDYVYDRRDYSGVIARRSFRWRATYLQPESRTQHGDRRLRLWVPWIRTQEDGRAFAREFFRMYAHYTSTYLIETVPQTVLPLPWAGQIQLERRDGSVLTTAQIETIRVKFDHAPVLRMELGPVDPRDLWPEPPHDERWERPDEQPGGGGDVTVTSSSGNGGPSSPATGGSSSNASSSPSLSFSGSITASTNSSGVSTLGSGLSGQGSSEPSSTGLSSGGSSSEISSGWQSVESSGTSAGVSSALYSSGVESAAASSGVVSSEEGNTNASGSESAGQSLDVTSGSSLPMSSPAPISSAGLSGNVSGSSFVSNLVSSTSPGSYSSQFDSMSGTATGPASSASTSGETGSFPTLATSGSGGVVPTNSSSAFSPSSSDWPS